MNITVIWPKKSPVFRREYCPECFGPVQHAARGRPRQFCSAACRQRRYREKTNFRSKAYRLHKDDRAVERQLRAYERAKGKRIDDVTPIIPGTRIDRRYHLIFGLRDKRRMEFCLWCGVPILREKHGSGYRRRCCSTRCNRKFGEFIEHMQIAVLHYRDSLDPEVIPRLRLYNLKSKRILPPIRTRVWLCDHCHKPFAATHLARKYCSKKCRQNAWYAAHKTCQFCKRRFRPSYTKARIQVYCSGSCRDRANHRKLTRAVRRICSACGVSFIHSDKDYIAKVYCSKQCDEKAWHAAEKTCLFCKRGFRPGRNNAWKQEYCSAGCRIRAIKRKPPLAIPRVCPECGEPFIADRHNYTSKVYCSQHCRCRASARSYRARKAGQRRILDFRTRYARGKSRNAELTTITATANNEKAGK